jgi:hypothetical protein
MSCPINVRLHTSGPSRPVCLKKRRHQIDAHGCLHPLKPRTFCWSGTADMPAHEIETQVFGVTQRIWSRTWVGLPFYFWNWCKEFFKKCRGKGTINQQICRPHEVPNDYATTYLMAKPTHFFFDERWRTRERVSTHKSHAGFLEWLSGYARPWKTDTGLWGD